MAPALDPGLAALLAVQAEDNAVEAGQRRLAALPERKVLEARQAALDALDAEITELTAPRHEIERRTKRLEDEAAGLRAKAHEAETAMYSGRVSALRELQALQEEVTSFNRRASLLEDEVLELMVDIEGRREGEAELGARREVLEAAAREATVALAEAEARELAELEAVRARRAEAAATVPPDALAEYERQRPNFGFATVVRLVGGRCEGCPLAIPAVEADRIRREEPGLATCGECGRLVLHG
jgi:predicted  nucleic acid-binding Zn-ribbon protein